MKERSLWVSSVRIRVRGGAKHDLGRSSPRFSYARRGKRLVVRFIRGGTRPLLSVSGYENDPIQFGVVLDSACGAAGVQSRRLSVPRRVQPEMKHPKYDSTSTVLPLCSFLDASKQTAEAATAPNHYYYH